VAEYLRKIANGEIRVLDTLNSPGSKIGALSWKDISEATQMSPRNEPKKERIDKK
jgi:hypothetical protein